MFSTLVFAIVFCPKSTSTEKTPVVVIIPVVVVVVRGGVEVSRRYVGSNLEKISRRQLDTAALGGSISSIGHHCSRGERCVGDSYGVSSALNCNSGSSTGFCLNNSSPPALTSPRWEGHEGNP